MKKKIWLNLLQIEITREITESNVFLFGNLAEDVEELRQSHRYAGFTLDDNLAKVFDAIRSNTFGDAGSFESLIASIADHGDYYLVSDDFDSYIKTQEIVDRDFKKRDEWIAKSITSVARMGFFSTDRVIDEYAESIWNVEPLLVE
jgi:starch phosphorylase